MTTEEAKKEAVRKAYGDKWEQVKDFVRMDDGSVPYYNNVDILSIEAFWYELGFEYNSIEVLDEEWEPSRWRPKSLSGIEDNRGWIRIEPDGSNLPEEKAEYWGMVLIQGKRQAAHVPFEPSSVMKSFWMKHVSHYQPIQKPEPPIY